MNYINNWKQIIQKVESIYIKKNQFNSCVQPYWEHLKDTLFFEYTDPSELEHLVDFNENVYFLTQDRKDKIWVYEGDMNSIITIINSCYLFEYYLVSKDFSWLICEKDHGVLIGSGDKIVNNMKKRNR